MLVRVRAFEIVFLSGFVVLHFTEDHADAIVEVDCVGIVLERVIEHVECFLIPPCVEIAIRNVRLEIGVAAEILDQLVENILGFVPSSGRRGVPALW